MTDVFLLGAGFSKAISDSMPVLTELSKALRSDIELPEHVTQLGDNVEHWMTYLSQSQPWISEIGNLENKAKFLELTQGIERVLNLRTQNALTTDCPDWLKHLLQWWHENKSAVITLNYDTLIERAIYFVNTGANQGLSPANIIPVPLPDIRRINVTSANKVDTFKLFKLHGSVNWFYSGAASYYGETIYSAPVTKWGHLDDSTEQSSIAAASDKVPLLIPPTAEKVAYFQHETLRRIWGQAGEALLTQNRLFCIGYSLPETDLSLRFFLQAHTWNRKIPLVIVNNDNGAPDHYRKLLGDSYDIDDAYVGADAIQRLIADLG